MLANSNLDAANLNRTLQVLQGTASEMDLLALAEGLLTTALQDAALQSSSASMVDHNSSTPVAPPPLAGPPPRPLQYLSHPMAAHNLPVPMSCACA